ncbi:family 20 glycosylhydrolase [Enterococcus sp. AZ109]|uniref:family 20 glycosylhydrolase n=1 Tax=Enterococcus sp. AZ109 TaxID=2774634 RepID=UPI003F26B914
MAKFNSLFMAETQATQLVLDRVSLLFMDFDYQIADSAPNVYSLQLDSSMEIEAKVEMRESKKIVGRTPAALFRGITRIILSQLTNKSFPERIHPKVEERIVMIDIGRKYYALEELKRLVRSMALFQFTHLQLHFSENEGFRIESTLHPEIVSAEFLTQLEVKALIDYAKQFYIEIIPDMDSPGHLQQLLRNYPKWQLPMIKNGELSRDVRALDIVNPEAVDFIKDVYREFAELFWESRYFHIGGDEFIDFDCLEKYPSLKAAALTDYGAAASGIEVFIQYVNELIVYMEDLGFTVRVWNDGFYRTNRCEQIQLSNSCEISYWTRWNPFMAPIETFLALDYPVINHNDNFFYYVLGEAAGYEYPTYERINHQFQLTTFANGQATTEADLAQTKGIAISVWADQPEAKQAVAVIDEIFWLEAALSEKIYEDTKKKEVYQNLFAAWTS